MKKIAKVWVLWFAFASSLVALLVSATWEFKSQVTLTLTEWLNTCILSDYMFEQKQASPMDQVTESLWQSINCVFLKNAENVVSLRLYDLSSSAGVVIPASWFTGIIASWTTIWTIWELSDQILTWLDTQPVIYNKAEDTIWEWTGTLTLQWVIPGGTPGWTYTGRLDLILQVN